MDTPTTHRTPRKVRTFRPECCAEEECTSGSRNNYFPGKRLTPDAFRIEQGYLIDRRHLLNRAIHGWGVVYGFPVAMAAPDRCPGAEQGTLVVGEGLALDKLGRELLEANPVGLTLKSVILLDGTGVPVRVANFAQVNEWVSKLPSGTASCWLLRVHYAERSIGPVALKDPCSCDRTEWDQVCETVRYSLQPIDCDKCCVDQDCELNCSCATGPCCEDKDQTQVKPGSYENDKPLVRPTAPPSKMSDAVGRGGCRCLCDHLSGLELGAECHSLSKVDECASADLRNGIALACVKLERDECGDWRFASVHDACGPRRLVKRNDLLFDLIRGCDATRIIDIGWKAWHRREDPVSFDDFSKALGAEGNGNAEYVTNDFWVTFSRPVRGDTLRPDCFAMTAMGSESEGGWWHVFRVPIVRVDTTKVPPEPGDPTGHVRSARIVVNGGWLEDAVRGRNSIFLAGDIHVEIEVRGDFILDCNGQTVDANARGLSPAPTGSDGPGDAFLSTFTVAERPEPHPKPKASR